MLAELYLEAGHAKEAAMAARKGLMVSCLNDGLWWSRYDAEAQRGRHFLQAARDERERIRRSRANPTLPTTRIFASTTASSFATPADRGPGKV